MYATGQTHFLYVYSQPLLVGFEAYFPQITGPVSTIGWVTVAHRYTILVFNPAT